MGDWNNKEMEAPSQNMYNIKWFFGAIYVRVLYLASRAFIVMFDPIRNDSYPKPEILRRPSTRK